MDTYDPDEDIPVSSWLGAYVNTYWNEYRHYWELSDRVSDPQFSERQRSINRSLDRVGQALRRCLHTLAVTPEARGEIRAFLSQLGIKTADVDSADAMRALHSKGLVRDAVLISLAFEATDSLLPSAEARAAELVALVATRQVTPRAALYLDRATRLYLWGFDPECIIMCRSVLEAALASRLEETIDLDQPTPSLDNLIRLAGEHGILAGFQRARNRKGWVARRDTPLWLAERIKWAGNRLVHDLPAIGSKGDGVLSAKAAIYELAALLGVLFP